MSKQKTVMVVGSDAPLALQKGAKRGHFLEVRCLISLHSQRMVSY